MDPLESDRRAVDQAFAQALLGLDELGVVVRSHAYVEANLNRFIELRLEAPQYLDAMDLNYSRKVELACALAHDLTAKLSDKSVRELFFVA